MNKPFILANIPKSSKLGWDLKHVHNRNKERKRTVSPNEPTYHMPAWTKLSKQVRDENPICAWYGKRPECQKESKITDHIVSMTDGGSALDRNNLQALCRSCSAAKTNMEKINRLNKAKKRITPTGLV